MATPTNLPASFVAGAILTAAQQNDLRGAFRVLQVVQGTTTTAQCREWLKNGGKALKEKPI